MVWPQDDDESRIPEVFAEACLYLRDGAVSVGGRGRILPSHVTAFCNNTLYTKAQWGRYRATEDKCVVSCGEAEGMCTVLSTAGWLLHRP